MKSLFISAINPPSALNTPGVGGTSTSRIRSSRARKHAIIGPAPPNARHANSRGSIPNRETSPLTSWNIPDTAIRMIASAVSSTLRSSCVRQLPHHRPRPP